MKPYYENDNGRLYHGDCLEILPHLDQVDLVLTDPPYGINHPCNFKDRGRGRGNSKVKMKLQLQPISQKEAFAFIKEHHRHHKPPVGWKFGVAVNDGIKVVGVITVGRPVARNLDNGYTVEVNRCCTDGTKNACSILYAAAWRAAKAMGYKRLITYILKSESGGSLKASGYKKLYETKGGSWDCKSRPRVQLAPTEQKQLWEAT